VLLLPMVMAGRARAPRASLSAVVFLPFLQQECLCEGCCRDMTAKHEAAVALMRLWRALESVAVYVCLCVCICDRLLHSAACLIAMLCMRRWTRPCPSICALLS